MSRKTLVVVVVVLVVAVGVAIGVFLFFFARQNGGALTFPLQNPFPTESGGRPAERADEDQELGPLETGGEANIPAPPVKLRKLHEEPVAGAYSFVRNGEPVARFVERATGHMFEVALASRRDPARISNTTVPRMQRAVWLTENTVLLQYLREDNETLESFLATLSGASTAGAATGSEGALGGIFLPADIHGLATRAGEALFLLGDNGASAFTISAGDEQAEAVASLPLSQWNTQWPTANIVALTTKPSARVSGFLYFLNRSNGSLERVLGESTGLTALVSPNTERILYSESERGSFTTSVFDIAQNETEILSLRTMPEKCAWSFARSHIAYCGVPEAIPSGEYPDEWYQGLVSFSDSLWVIDTQEGTVELLASPTESAREEIDVARPSLSPNERFLTFLNKKDSSLWALTLPELPEAGTETEQE